MVTFLIRLLIGLLIMLVVVVIAFALLDRLIKGGSKKVSEITSAPKEKPAEKPVKEPVLEVKSAPQAAPQMEIYNSGLADDLNSMLKNSSSASSSRLQIENHLNKKGNIAKYIKDKNYHGFDFGSEDVAANSDDDNEEPLSFTREDYKRIMALSNIDDDKPL